MTTGNDYSCRTRGIPSPKRTARSAVAEWVRLPNAQKACYRQQMEEERRRYAQLKAAYDEKMKSRDT